MAFPGLTLGSSQGEELRQKRMGLAGMGAVYQLMFMSFSHMVHITYLEIVELTMGRTLQHHSPISPSLTDVPQLSMIWAIVS